MYHQINPTEMIRERHLALLKEAEERHLARRLRSGRETKAIGTIAVSTVGLLAALVVAGLMLAALSSPAYASTTFSVTNTNDSDAGSLRQAILDANATSGPDTINFSIPGAGVHTISPDSELPNITEAVAINGYSQPGSSLNTLAVGNNAVLKIELSGASAPGGYGLQIGAANSTVKGLVINRWASGVRLGGNDATANRIVGNYIGTNASGTQVLGNGTSGVTIVDARNNTIGGTETGARNRIAFNGDFGVLIAGNSATGNRVLSNSIFSTGGLGIDLGANGLTPNDAGDGDTGPNTLQNKPVLSSAKTTGTQITIQGTLNSTPNQSFTIQFFSNLATEPAGNEGRKFLGQKSVSTGPNGNVSFTRGLAVAVPAGQKVTATATGPGGNTSEFSAARVLVQQ
jgi:hypothetical protein